MKSQRAIIALLSVVAVAVVVIAVVLVLELRDKDNGVDTFGTGTFLVGTDVQSGEYATDGPVGDDAMCTVFISKKPDDVSSLVDSRVVTEKTKFTLSTGLYVTSTGCTWTKLG